MWGKRQYDPRTCVSEHCWSARPSCQDRQCWVWVNKGHYRVQSDVHCCEHAEDWAPLRRHGRKRSAMNVVQCRARPAIFHAQSSDGRLSGTRCCCTQTLWGRTVLCAISHPFSTHFPRWPGTAVTPRTQTQDCPGCLLSPTPPNHCKCQTAVSCPSASAGSALWTYAPPVVCRVVMGTPTECAGWAQPPPLLCTKGWGGSGSAPWHKSCRRNA